MYNKINKVKCSIKFTISFVKKDSSVNVNRESDPFGKTIHQDIVLLGKRQSGSCHWENVRGVSIFRDFDLDPL